MILSVVPAVAPPPAGAREDLRLRVVRHGARSLREFRLDRGVGATRVALLARRRDGRADVLRVGLELGFAGGWLALGHHRDPGGGREAGWSSALAGRTGPRVRALSLGRADPGVSWHGQMRGAAVRVGAGRARSGVPVAGGRIEVRGLAVSVRVEGPDTEWGVAGAGRRGRLPWRAGVTGRGSACEWRGGLGGGGAPLGLVATAGGGHWRAAGGLRAVRGAWRGTRAEVRVGSARPETEAEARVTFRRGAWRWEAEIGAARRGPSSRRRVRATVGARLPRAAAEVSVAGPSPAAELRVETGHSRSGSGFRVELPAGRPRRITAWIARRTRFGGLRLGVRGNRGAPASVDLEWRPGASPAARARD